MLAARRQRRRAWLVTPVGRWLGRRRVKQLDDAVYAVHQLLCGARQKLKRHAKQLAIDRARRKAKRVAPGELVQRWAHPDDGPASDDELAVVDDGDEFAL